MCRMMLTLVLLSVASALTSGTSRNQHHSLTTMGLTPLSANGKLQCWIWQNEFLLRLRTARTVPVDVLRVATATYRKYHVFRVVLGTR